ncbi:HD domain-containing phosphohydrolase [Nonomuraea lactucae]|uniref:HD domain-containing phosphohydrolase n=1 Tax=Nonomuraea lactucae TaxID=2249762 RepID=UPI0013B427C4|nr:HD domain-containing phosphohydrolase [Nonomuraea lactucae]
MPFEKGLRTSAVATKLAGALLGGDPLSCRVVFETAMLRSVGCTSYAPELAAIFRDDVAFQAALKTLDTGDEKVFATQLRTFGDWAGDESPGLARTLVEVFPTVGVEAMRNGCETSRALGAGLGLRPESIEALDDVYERWDGCGIPDGRRGAQLSLAARIVHVAEQAVLAHAVGGVPAAVAEVRRRSGGHLDPELAKAFLAAPDVALASLEHPDAIAMVLDVEPAPHVTVPFGSVPRLCAVLARVVDLKSQWLLGHSEHVATLAADAGRLAGMDPDAVTELHCAGLLHDLGRVGVSSSVWDRPGPLGLAEMERVRMHTYWTQRVLERVPVLASLAPIASAHHERVDGGGYHRGDPSANLALPARILAAADVFAALTEPRAHRAAFTVEAAADLLAREAGSGALDGQACAVVIEAAGRPRPRSVLPAGLTEREVEVLCLAARGLRNREIGERLSISGRTVGHHLSHIYDKTGRRTRAGVAVFAMEHGLLP